jgi:dolichol-phosphate mannosyltransferase
MAIPTEASPNGMARAHDLEASPKRSTHVSVVVCVEGTPAPGLPDFLRDVVEQLEKRGCDHDVLLVLGAVPPAVSKQIRELKLGDPEHVRVLRSGSAMGAAALLSAGFEQAQGEVLLTLPPRLEVEPGVVGELLDALDEGADVAFASRNADASGLARRQSLWFNGMISWAAGTRFRDVAGGTRALRREVLAELPLYGDFHRYLPVLAERLGFAVREIEGRRHPDAREPGVHAPRLYLWRALDVLSIFFLARFTRRPLRLFGGVGAMFGSLGAVLLTWLGAQRLMGVPLGTRPLLVLAILLLGLGVQTLSIGLLGELILFFHARRQRDYRVKATYGASRGEAPPDE